MMHRTLTGHDHFASMRTPTGSLLPQEPAHRLLCRALELLVPRELGLGVIEKLVLDDANGTCGGAIRHLNALVAELGARNRAAAG